jgi:hypothetical protein
MANIASILSIEADIVKVNNLYYYEQVENPSTPTSSDTITLSNVNMLDETSNPIGRLIANN